MQSAQTAHQASDLLSAEQVQAMLGVDKSTVYRMAADGRLSAIKVGRQWRFPAGPIRALLDSAGVVVRDADSPDDPGPIQPIVDLAAGLLGVMMVATDMEGRPLTEVANPSPWFATRQDDPAVLEECISDWRMLARELDFEPRLVPGSHGFECARAFVRDRDRLIGMVLAGGIEPAGGNDPDLYHLDANERAALLSALPRVATTISRVIARTVPHPLPTRSTP
jgi:excisionase family DNA binding protein